MTTRSGSSPRPDDLALDDLAAAGAEREVLEAFLDQQRRVIVRKVADLSEEQARRRHVPSATTLAGIVRHLTAVERNWFQFRLAQRPAAQLGPNRRGDEASWQLGPADILERLVADYEAACAESRRIAAGMALDDSAPHPRLGMVSLRWVLVHMIEETARHAGHADILRERTDGAAGVDG